METNEMRHKIAEELAWRDGVRVDYVDGPLPASEFYEVVDDFLKAIEALGLKIVAREASEHNQ